MFCHHSFFLNTMFSLKVFFSLYFISVLLTKLDKFIAVLISLHMFFKSVAEYTSPRMTIWILTIWQNSFQAASSLSAKFFFSSFWLFFPNLYFGMPDNTIYDGIPDNKIYEATSAARRYFVANVRRIQFAPAIYLALLFLIWSPEYSF